MCVFFFRVQVFCYSDISLTLIDVLTILNSNSMAYEEIGNSVFVFSKRLTFYRHKGSGKNSSQLHAYISTILSHFKDVLYTILPFFFTDCRYLGKFYKAGEVFPKGDNCNSCTCTVTGDVRCDNRSCSPVVTTTMPPLPTKLTPRFIGTGEHLTLLSSIAKAVNETEKEE